MCALRVARTNAGQEPVAAAIVPEGSATAAPDGPKMQRAAEPAAAPVARTRRSAAPKQLTAAQMRAAVEHLVAEPQTSFAPYLRTRALAPFLSEGPQDTRYFYLDAALVLAAAGITSWKGKRVLDIGANDCGFVAMAAASGARRAVGVDVTVHPDLPLAEQTKPAYEHVLGSFPAQTGAAVGTGFDVIVARNVFKRGFVEPNNGEPAFVDLGVPRDEYLRQLAQRLAPGGVFLLFNAWPKDPAVQHHPMADGTCPFSREELEAAGFEVVAHRLDATFFGKVCMALLGIELGETGSEVTLLRR